MDEFKFIYEVQEEYNVLEQAITRKAKHYYRQRFFRDCFSDIEEEFWPVNTEENILIPINTSINSI